LALFNRLLLALDLSSHSEDLVERVAEVCREDVDNLHVIHVIKQGMHDGALVNAESCDDSHAQRQKDHTHIQVREMLLRHGLRVSSDKIYLLRGEPAYEIKKLAREIGADLVIVGSHNKDDDLFHLPGATTNCVIQGMPSDVMAVKV
jgi:universal stress protein A